MRVRYAGYMKSKKVKYDIDAIKDAADPEGVASAIGMDLKKYGRRISVLCPAHDDRHHGSCFLTESGCHCYSCGKSMDVIDMVQFVCDITFTEALGMIADLCGGRDRFVISGKAEEKFSIISRADMKLIGIFNSPVYAVKTTVPDYTVPPRKKGLRYTWYPAEKVGDEDYYLVEECVQKNPLGYLANNDRAVYYELIRGKAFEALGKSMQLWKVMRLYNKAIASEYEMQIKRIKEIWLKHGGKTSNLRKVI